MTAAIREIRLHGHTVSYRMEGAGPAIVLLHGITGSSETWQELIPTLAKNFTVIAPDLLGHGQSAKPPTEYSMGAYASSVRDLLTVLRVMRVTLVGHSLGGGVAMQFSYQFPEMCERLVLVSSGGLGRELHPILRLAALPGAEWVLPRLCSPVFRDVVDRGASLLGRLGLRTGTDSPGGLAELRLTLRRGRATGLHLHRAHGDRHRRSTGQRPRSAVPGFADSDAHHLG